MAKRQRVLVLDRARSVLLQCTPAERAQFDRLVAVLRMAPTSGVFYAHDLAGRVLYQVSSAELHLIYTLIFTVQEDRILIVAIDVAAWNPQHSDMP